MLNSTIKNKQVLALSTVMSFLAVYALFIWQGNSGFSLADEGYLWYGTQRVLLGDVPIRDFMAYDPGRYYWSAAIMSLVGNNSIMTLRFAATVFQELGLLVGLFLITRNAKKLDFLYALISCLILVIWMHPRHKLFDISLSIFIIGLLVFLIENPTNKRFFITGACVGLIAFFGRNHGVYAIAGSLGVMLWLNIKKHEQVHFSKNFLNWSAGVIAGFSPTILMSLIIPGFAHAFWESIRFLFEVKATNLPLPIPWPWLIQFNSLPLNESIRGLFIGLFFIGVPTFGVLSIAWVIWGKIKSKQIQPIVVATAFLTLPYAQYAFSRADVNHLAQGIFPVLIGSLALLSTQPAKIKWPMVFALAGGSLWVMLSMHPGWQCYQSAQCVPVEISKNTLKIDPATANDIKLLRQLVLQYAPDNQSFIATPLWPGAYALFERKAPMWEIYALFHRSPQFEQIEIERIKKAHPGFAFILDVPLDGQDDLRFKNTHPMISQYVMTHFALLPDLSTSNYQIFKKIETGN